MEVNFKGNFEEFLYWLDGSSQIVMWGVGECAEDFIAYYQKITQKKLDIKYFVDKNFQKWDGERVCSPKKLGELSDKDCMILIATQYDSDVLKELEIINFPGRVYSAFRCLYKLRWGDTSEIEKNMPKLQSILADEKSKWLAEEICRKRKNLDVDYSEIFERNQYFVSSLIKKNSHAIFVDAGAYDGETIKEFIKFQNNEFDKIYSFEMDRENYKKIIKHTWDERIEIYNLGLWDKQEQCAYNHSESSSSIGKGDYVAECVKLDDIIKETPITFLKMDIEGAELPALHGAEQSIKRWKPQLAICIYHKQNDLWEIPFFIHSMVPEYRLYIRHHMPNINETVLYAVL